MSPLKMPMKRPLPASCRVHPRIVEVLPVLDVDRRGVVGVATPGVPASSVNVYPGRALADVEVLDHDVLRQDVRSSRLPILMTPRFSLQ